MFKKIIFVALSVVCCLGSYQIIFSQKTQEIVIPIEGTSSGEKASHFEKGEFFRTQMRFADAIREYRKVILPGELCDKESEAHYNIGLCYTWLGKLDSARIVFEEVIRTYPHDGIAVGWAQYGLTWVDIQKGKYQQAIERLQNKLGR